MKKAFTSTYFLIVAIISFGQDLPLVHAHAHNDYLSQKPFFLAIENGFSSIEVDVHYLNHKLYVSHDTPALLHDSLLLENMYLKPLFERVNRNNGFVFLGKEAPLFLMIDFKTGADSTYQALRSALKPYQTLLCTNEQLTGCPVKIFVSGNRPVDQILSEGNGYVSLDGRLEDLNKNISPEIMPVISENYYRLKAINGMNNLSLKEKLLAWVAKAHLEGKKVRLWGAPDDEATWKYLLDNGVDLINTDKIEEFANFLKSGY